MNRGLPPALRLLAEVKDSVADDALAAAVPHLQGETLAAVVNLLIERGHTPAQVDLLRCRRHTPAFFDPLLLPRVNELHPALSALLFDSDLDDRLAAAQLIEKSKDTACADLLVEALRHTCVRTRQAAAEAMGAMVEHLLNESCSTPERVAELQQKMPRLTLAVQSALEAWRQHHQAGVLQAGLRLMPARGGFLTRAAEQTGTPLAHALEKAIEDASDPDIAEAVVRSLSIPSLRAAAALAISRASQAPFIMEVLRAAWLVADPAVRHGCLLIRKSKWEPQWLEVLVSLGKAEIPAAVAFIHATGGSTEAKATLFRQLLGSSKDRCRRAGFWAAIGQSPEPAARQLLESIAARDEDELSAIAKLECARASGALSALSPHTASSPASHPEEVAAIRNGLSNTHAFERVRSLAAIERSHAPATFKEEVLRLLRDSSPAVRSAAVALLPGLGATNPTYLLRQSLADPDPRVRANAVEAADALHLKELLPMIVPLMHADDARLRANAIKFCAQEGVREAGEALIAMLESASPTLRRSALWVAERLYLLSLAPRVEALAVTDPDEAVKRYANSIAQRFVHATTPWMGRSGVIAG